VGCRGLGRHQGSSAEPGAAADRGRSVRYESRKANLRPRLLSLYLEDAKMTRDIEWSHSVMVSIAVPYGRRAFRIPFSEVERFKLDQIGVAAQLLDMPREDYVRWVEQEGSVQCMATTKQGKRCRIGSQRGMRKTEWMALDREGFLCHVHGGGSASQS
jgi:hypothetical protein